MTRDASIMGKPTLVLICCVAVGTLWARPTACQEGRVDVGPPGQPQVVDLPKLSPLLAGTLKRLDSAGVTRGTVGAYDVEHFSTPLVHLNQRGEIQVEIEVERLNDAALNELRAAGVTIEHTNGRHCMIQGWVPFEVLESLAQLANVKQIRPPAYAVPRSRTVIPGAANRR